MTPTLVAVDFDGTITTRDTLHVIVEEFGAAGVWDRLEPGLRRGEISIEDAMSQQFAAVTATREEVLPRVLAASTIRDGFSELLDWVDRRGVRLAVLSAGFRDVIDAVFANAGIRGLQIHSNDIRFAPDGAELVFAERGGECGHCGRRCKRHVLRTLMRHDERVAYVGDGVSDQCVSTMADVVFARASLAEYLDAQSWPYRPFENFYDVVGGLEAVMERPA